MFAELLEFVIYNEWIIFPTYAPTLFVAVISPEIVQSMKLDNSSATPIYPPIYYPAWIIKSI